MSKGGAAEAPTRCLRGLARDPLSSGLDLAVLSRNTQAAAAILAALPAPARAAAAAAAAAKWTPHSPAACSTGSGGSYGSSSRPFSQQQSHRGGDDAAVLGLLLEAGADPFPLLPRLLPRYEWSVQVAHCQPFYQQLNPYRDALAVLLRSRRCQAAAAAAAESADGGSPCCTPEQRSQLLLAAVFCRDAPLCLRLIAGASKACWARHAANCHLLVAAAEHDLPAVVPALLAVRTPGGGQPFQVAPPPGALAPGVAPLAASMAHEGCTPLMAAAERNSCAALRLLLAKGAAVNAADDDGVSALHWAVIGGAYEAAELLLQAGASPSQPCAAQPDGLHLERPLLTAVREGHCQLARLLLAHGAQLDAPTERGCTPLSVAVACEQVEAARMLLALGADARQVLPAAINAGRYRDASLTGSGQQGAAPAAPPPPPAAAAARPPASYASLLGLAASRRRQAAPLLALLLGTGASPAPAGAAPAPALASAEAHCLPLPEAAAAGAVGGAACLLQWAEQRGVPLEQLGWAAAAEVAARRSLASDCHHELLCLLLEAWQAQAGRRQGGAPLTALPADACTALVAALLEAHTQQQAAHMAAGQGLDAGCELQAVLLAERLAEVGLCADLTASLATAPHNRCVALAALPPAQRWSQRTHTLFPPAFKAAARQLLLSAAYLERRGPPAGSSASLASLPPHLLCHIIRLASTPLSFWLSSSKH